MANAKYASTRETTNLARIARIILGPCTDVLCDVLKKEIPPSTLSQKVKIYLATLPKQKQLPITKEQKKSYSMETTQTLIYLYSFFFCETYQAFHLIQNNGEMNQSQVTRACQQTLKEFD